MMDKRRLGLGLLLFALPLTAHADRHKIGMRMAFANAQRSSLKGGQFSTEIPLARKGKSRCCCCCAEPRPDCCGKDPSSDCCGKDASAGCPPEGSLPAPEAGAKRTLSAVLEGSVVAGDHEGEHLEQFSYLSGLRFSLNKHKGIEEKVEAYVQALVGGSHDSRGEIQDRPQVGFGAGVFVPVKAWRGWGVSFQVDRYGLLGESAEWFTCYSLGIVWRYGE
jgi:hypothetical protein